jgi:hypothetical protein
VLTTPHSLAIAAGPVALAVRWRPWQRGNGAPLQGQDTERLKSHLARYDLSSRASIDRSPSRNVSSRNCLGRKGVKLLDLLRTVLTRLKPYGYGYIRGGGYVFPRANRRLVSISPGTALHGALFNAWDPISLGPGVVLGHEVMFLTGYHEMAPDGLDPRPSRRGPIEVGADTWIGSRAIILGGTRIGERCVIGAGSVVTRSIPAREFWAGNPARRIRTVSS